MAKLICVNFVAQFVAIHHNTRSAKRNAVTPSVNISSVCVSKLKVPKTVHVQILRPCYQSHRRTVYVLILNQLEISILV
jgi:hypothetical protein